jgi:hypothetical protein
MFRDYFHELGPSSLISSLIDYVIKDYQLSMALALE